MKTKEEVALEVISQCPHRHSIDSEQVTLFRNPKYEGNALKQLCTTIENKLEEYANQSKWISVKDEQKPKLGQKVLVIQNPLTTATREPLFAIYNGKDFTPPEPTYFATFEIGKSIWSDITHWMPLPNLPEIKTKQ